MKRIGKWAIALSLVLVSCGQSSKSVYICTGPQSHRYHKTSSCPGLSRCSCDVEKVTLEKAKAMGRTECGKCY